MTHQETVESARLRARLRVDNALVYARHVSNTFGLLSPEYAVALQVVQHEQAQLLATYAETTEARAA